MCNPFRIQCGRDSSPAVAQLHLQLGSHADPDANVFLEIERLLQAVWREIPTVLHDLIEIACYVYAADQAISRGDTWIPADGELGRGWRRDLQFHVPVRHPDIWQQSEVSNTLVKTLAVLSKDRYEFVFRPLDRAQPLQARLGFTETPYDGMIDEVMLFSGGLDSLSGAVQEVLVDRRKVLLVHHRSNEKLSPRHHRLLTDFEQLAKATPPIHIPVWMNKSKALSVEFTQRTRSFVFMALAATLAAMVGRDRIRFYENGVVSLNLPLSAQVVGARATRTTHPMVLNGYAQLVSLLIQKPFQVENPFIWETKTQIVERIARAGGGALIGHSTSCAHTRTRTMAQPHCGICSQCIDRRFAVLAAGQGSHDPAAGYEVDLMTGERDVGESRMMLAGFLERANQLVRMNEKQFFSTYGQASRVFRHLPGSASEVAERIYSMYCRHAFDVARVVDQGFRDHATAIRQRTLPSSCLLRLVADPANPQPPRREVPADAKEPNLFRKRGQVWEIRFEGGAVNQLIHSKGAA